MRETARCLIRVSTALFIDRSRPSINADSILTFRCYLLRKEHPLLPEKEARGNVEEENGTNRDKKFLTRNLINLGRIRASLDISLFK